MELKRSVQFKTRERYGTRLDIGNLLLLTFLEKTGWEWEREEESFPVWEKPISESSLLGLTATLKQLNLLIFFALSKNPEISHY